MTPRVVEVSSISNTRGSGLHFLDWLLLITIAAALFGVASWWWALGALVLNLIYAIVEYL